MKSRLVDESTCTLAALHFKIADKKRSVYKISKKWSFFFKCWQFACFRKHRYKKKSPTHPFPRLFVPSPSFLLRPAYGPGRGCKRETLKYLQRLTVSKVRGSHSVEAWQFFKLVFRLNCVTKLPLIIV